MPAPKKKPTTLTVADFAGVTPPSAAAPAAPLFGEARRLPMGASPGAPLPVNHAGAARLVDPTALANARHQMAIDSSVQAVKPAYGTQATQAEAARLRGAIPGGTNPAVAAYQGHLADFLGDFDKKYKAEKDPAKRAEMLRILKGL
jgi:hypothetical protein